MVDFPYRRRQRCSVTDNQILTQSHCYHCTDHTYHYRKITAVIIHSRVSLFLFLDWVRQRGHCMWGGINANEPRGLNYTGAHGDCRNLRRAFSHQFSSMP